MEGVIALLVGLVVGFILGAAAVVLKIESDMSNK